jgi:hypothetical protein
VVKIPIHPNDFDRRHRLQSEGHIIVFSMGGRGIVSLFVLIIWCGNKVKCPRSGVRWRIPPPVSCFYPITYSCTIYTGAVFFVWENIWNSLPGEIPEMKKIF